MEGNPHLCDRGARGLAYHSASDLAHLPTTLRREAHYQRGFAVERGRAITASSAPLAERLDSSWLVPCPRSTTACLSLSTGGATARSCSLRHRL